MKKLIYLFSVTALLFSSCNYLDVEPTGKVIPDEVEEFRGLLTAAYAGFPTHKHLLSVRSDEMLPDNFGLSFNEYMGIVSWDDSNSDPLTPIFPWTSMYKVIFYANSVIQDAPSATNDGGDDTKEQLIGEAYLLRAYAHFELLNLYAVPYNAATAATDKGIPMQLKIDVNQEFKRASVADVYSQILADISEGLKYIEVEKQEANRRFQFSRQAGLAFKARVLTYMANWEEALATAQQLIPGVELEDLTAEKPVVPSRYDSKENILALEMAVSSIFWDDFYMSDEFMSSNFDMTKVDGAYGDKRLTVCFTSRLGVNKPYGTTGKVTFRAAEAYLIAAEAAANIGNLTEAVNNLKILNEKRLVSSLFNAKLATWEAMSQQELIAEIAKERAREFVVEGHRWYDLRRTTRPSIVKVFMDDNFDFITKELQENDARYVIAFPKEAIANNPDLLN
ncbi:MAG: RagB/SusD family nutrient uptake outer membrane protein [Marinifilaceae bacterium]